MKIKNLLFLLVGIILVSCIQEDEDLVNPPSKAETVQVRFLNLAGDKEPRSMVYEGMYETESIAYGDASTAVNPPADSSILEVKKGGSVEFMQKTIVKYIRNSVYTFIALPSIDTAEVQRDVDTIVYFRTTAAVDRFSNDAYVKFFNGVNDPDISFSLKIGCPNGDPVKNSAQFRERMSQPVSIRSGTVAFSLVKNTNEPEIVDLYEVELEPRKQYLFVALEDNTGEYNLLVVEEENPDKEGVYYAKIIEARNTFIRGINLTAETIDITRKSEEIFNSLANEYVSDYKELEVCKGSDKDTINTYINNELVSQNSLSLDVLEQYSIFTAEGMEESTYINMIAEPARFDKDVSGKAIVRTVNAANNYDGLTVSIGARTDDSETGFSSGINLANRIEFGNISNAELIEPGILPVVVFTATAPAELLYSTKIEVEPDKSYFVAITNTENEPLKVSVFESEETQKSVEYKEPGVFSQVVNALYDKDSLFVQINPPMLEHGRLGSSGSLATVLNAGTQNISINDNTISVDAETDKRVLVIAYGESENPSSFVINSNPMGATANNYYWRFANVSNVPEVGIKESEDEDINLVNVAQNTYTPEDAVIRENKKTLYFYDNSTGDELYRLSDVQLNFGKNYTIIFTGDSPQNYNTIIQQEF